MSVLMARALQAEGSLWRAAALLVAGGQLRAAAAALRESGAADAAHGLTAACREACAVAGLVEQVRVLVPCFDTQGMAVTCVAPVRT